MQGQGTDGGDCAHYLLHHKEQSHQGEIKGQATCRPDPNLPGFKQET